MSAPRGGCLLQGGPSAPGGVCSGGVCSRGGGCDMPACTEADTPPVDRQMPVKT